MDKQNFTERNRRDIVAIATQHFAEKGYAGARVDEIAAATATSKRMIYYHFGSKDGLYRAVLTEAYRGIRSAELEAELSDLPPLAALERLTALTFDYHFNHPELVRLVMDENIRGGPHVGEISEGHNEIVLPKTQALIDRGIADGSFRAGLDAVDLHMTISALAFYFVSNRHSFHAIFGVDMTSEAAAKRRRAQVIDNVLRYCRADA
ncbi:MULTISPECIES: TetR/AcrR family transcriptional regulator [Sphingobium]|uniref:TetR family transcriptional regulator n=1 Tax=Sphingobium yanoikuyae TaxID=13690 RepID=A0A0J9D6K6_SPHYA|nr:MULTISPECIES: TetR/AcrR family transcriptional regulator [Sphingobium]ATP20159.1 TetR family transcriptional regulator [Sphingobium yanoikuyae]KMW32136.1 TetR family transcriptional regulator [Sphingobium yanoikuyae]TKV40801.1 TetR family transcriptional regulator [Sphingobium sp. MP9-4]